MPISVTPDLILRVMPDARSQATVFAVPLAAAALRFGISTEQRMSAFLAQVAHESGQLQHLIENLNYSAQRLLQVFGPKRVSIEIAARIEHQPVLIGNHIYAGMNGNGDEASGDGYLYRGRGPIGYTGRANYRIAGVSLQIPLEDLPQLMEQPDVGALAAGLYWQTHGCNELADRDDFQSITHAINGGLNGYQERVLFWNRARAYYGLPAVNGI